MTHCNKKPGCIYTGFTIDCTCTLLVFVLALELHMLMLVSPPVSFLFSDVLIFVFFVQATSFNEHNASLVAFQVL